MSRTVVTKNWRWRETRSVASCAKESIRTVVRESVRGHNTVMIRVCCPKGQYAANSHGGACTGGMKTLAVGKRRTKLPSGRKIA